jgi:hypothetical protein
MNCSSGIISSHAVVKRKERAASGPPAHPRFSLRGELQKWYPLPVLSRQEQTSKEFNEPPANGGNDATITVVNNVKRFSVSDLSEINNSTNVNGWTPRKERRWPPGGPWYGEMVSPYENYTANNTEESYLFIQTHELGHSLADITDVAVPFKGLPMPSDVDTGAWFLDCVEDAYKPNPQ